MIQTKNKFRYLHTVQIHYAFIQDFVYKKNRHNQLKKNVIFFFNLHMFCNRAEYFQITEKLKFTHFDEITVLQSISWKIYGNCSHFNFILDGLS